MVTTGVEGAARALLESLPSASGVEFEDSDGRWFRLVRATGECHELFGAEKDRAKEEEARRQVRARVLP